MMEVGTCMQKVQCEIAGHENIPVAQGSPEPLKGGMPCVADFVHGKDGLGNTFLPSPKGNQWRFYVCKQSEENSYTWWCILCLGECESCCRSKCKWWFLLVEFL
ncbi:hypothetical protein GLYMA_04G126900v4 [Glycine max]|uniref:Uncharacterized protein n=2 Tax=Glycine subgen. Soja TaxID=1462606 RepID=A0A0R0KF02_SOYBN|nr:hypothetical protein GYH30_009760 [Glycine max]KRH62725.1 hypothetical protein GLYMA_04G126900v4 [Glycine max]RZC16321.1 putative uridine nucleosidase 1 [Glycine soja]